MYNCTPSLALKFIFSLSLPSQLTLFLSLFFASYDRFLPICKPLSRVIPPSYLLLVPACLKKSLLLPCLLQSHLLLDNWNHAWNTGEDREHVERPNSISRAHIDGGFSANLSLSSLIRLVYHHCWYIMDSLWELTDSSWQINFLPADFVWFTLWRRLKRPVMLSFIEPAEGAQTLSLKSDGTKSFFLIDDMAKQECARLCTTIIGMTQITLRLIIP